MNIYLYKYIRNGLSVMKKRIVISGCRDYNNYEEAKTYIDFLITEIRKEYELIFVTGGCRGADMLGKRYAVENGFAVETYPADWKKYGKSAGPIRNGEMAKVGDYFICFWDGKSQGTKSMINLALAENKPIKVKKITVHP